MRECKQVTHLIFGCTFLTLEVEGVDNYEAVEQLASVLFQALVDLLESLPNVVQYSVRTKYEYTFFNVVSWTYAHHNRAVPWDADSVVRFTTEGKSWKDSLEREWADLYHQVRVTNPSLLSWL